MSLLGAARSLRGVLVRGLEVFLVISFAVLTVDVLWGVFSRYVLGAQSRWTEELAIYLLVWISLLGGALTYGERGHLGVDYFVGKMVPEARRAAAFAVEILVAFFAVFALMMGGWVLITKTLESGQVSPALGVPMGYLYFSAPVSGCFFLLFSIEHLMEIVAGAPEERSDLTDV